MRSKHAPFLFLAAFMLACGWLESFLPDQTQPQVSSHPPQIAFLAYTDEDIGISDIQLVNEDGSGRTRITDGSGWIEGFSWSPDGSRLAFDWRAPEAEQVEIYLVNADGSSRAGLTSTPSGGSRWPAWSHDGSKVAYTCYLPEAWICVINVSDEQVTRLTPGETPAWSPDDSQIAFSLSNLTFAGDLIASPEDGLYVMSSDGSNIQRLTDSSAYGWDNHPAWSPDSTRILIASNRHSPGWALTDTPYVINADGSDALQLSTTWGNVPFAWSPDGKRVAFAQGFGSGATLWAVNADGGNEQPLISEETYGWHPVWRP
jgi:Tol biopolymer transport system component